MKKLADEEMEKILHEEIDRCKKIITEHRHLVEKLADRLVEKESLDIIEIKSVLGERPFQPEESIKKAIEDVSFGLILD